jgi:4-carboxymuconolactone decarboxylase
MAQKYLTIKKDLTNLVFNSSIDISSVQKIIVILTVLSIKRSYKHLFILFEILKEKIFSRKKQYEIILQLYLFAGFPLALETLKLLNQVNPLHSKKIYSEDYSILYTKGIQNCRKVYKSKIDKLIYNVSLFSPELSNWLIIEGYGKIFSRKGITFQEREIISVTVLSLLKYKDQLYSHINGAFQSKLSIQKLCDIIDYIELVDSKASGNFARKILLQFSVKKGIVLKDCRLN